MSRDFTLEKYTELCHAIRHLPCDVMTVAEFIRAGQPHRPVMILRHDIDRAPNTALRMAKLEAQLGIRSTYYSRMTQAVFRPQMLLRLHEMNHEVGYHYEVLAKTHGNHEQAIALFENELIRIRQVVPVVTISMHGSPLSPWDNLDLWKDHEFTQFGLSELFLSIDYQSIYYFTDTGRCWEPNRYNLRDRIVSRKSKEKVLSTDDLMRFLEHNHHDPVLINTHPNRWSANWLEWGISLVSDWVINQAKYYIGQSNWQNRKK